MFPSEFADLLNARGRKLLSAPQKLDAFRKRGPAPIAVFDDIVDPRRVPGCVEALERAIYPHLRRMHTPIPREALTKMKQNYSERLQKTVRVKTVTFNAGRSKALQAAEEIGVAQMLRSESFRTFAEHVVGGTLTWDHAGRQIICYEPGDYSGPHNDHHPERPEAKNGFVDIHVMFANAAVASQLLVYENRGFLSDVHEVGVPSSVAVYRLPFWHYTTPLIAKKGREAEARRWLLLGSFDFDPPLPKLMY